MILEQMNVFFYYITMPICWAVQKLYELFDVFSGVREITYNGKENYLIRVFFSHSVIDQVYKSISWIGIVLCIIFGCTMFARKIMDPFNEKYATMGTILRQTVQGIVLIAIMSSVIGILVEVTIVGMKELDSLFREANSLSVEDNTITFTEEDYGIMAQIYNTIGNYALNRSYDSQYNINNCYNSIREDLYLLESKNIFTVSYKEVKKGKVVDNWQSVLLSIATSADLKKDMKVTDCNEGLNEALLHAMEVLRTNQKFYPLKSYKENGVSITSQNMRIDAVLFLFGTMNAANNSKYNQKPALTDMLRWQYLSGGKDIYSMEQIANDFVLSKIQFILILLVSIFIGIQFLMIAINCISRIFNMMILYIVSPAFIAFGPMDNGNRTKRWMNAFAVQSFGVFGTIVAVRLLMIFVPIMLSDNLRFFSDAVALDFFARIIMIAAAARVCNKVNDMIADIIENSESWQVFTGKKSLLSMVSGMFSLVGNAGKAVGNVAMGTGKVALGAGNIALGAGKLVLGTGKLVAGTGQAAVGVVKAGVGLSVGVGKAATALGKGIFGLGIGVSKAATALGKGVVGLGKGVLGLGGGISKIVFSPIVFLLKLFPHRKSRSKHKKKVYEEKRVTQIESVVKETVEEAVEETVTEETTEMPLSEVKLHNQNKQVHGSRNTTNQQTKTLRYPKEK